MDLRLIVRFKDDITIIACVGRLVYGDEAASLRTRVKGFIAQGAKSIALDLAGVTYLDSGALGVLTGPHMSAQQANCHFRLVNLTPRTAKLLQTTNLTNFFDIEASTSVQLRTTVQGKVSDHCKDSQCDSSQPQSAVAHTISAKAGYHLDGTERLTHNKVVKRAGIVTGEGCGRSD